MYGPGVRRLQSTKIVSVLAPLALAVIVAGCGGTGGAATTHTRSTVNSSVQAKTSKPKAHRSREVRNAKPQPNWKPYTGPVPILVYHALGPVPPGEPWPGLYVSYATFRAEMAWLHQQGYQAVTLDEVMSSWYHGGTLPAKPIVITFDNGYPEQVTFAPRVLARYGWPGVLNEITAGHLHNNQIRHVLKMGWEVDSHSVSHPDLTVLSPAELQYQLVSSRKFLQRTFKIPVNSFCYPSSRYNATVIAAVKAAGYTNAVTEGHAYATRANPYLLPRFEIEGGVPELAADLATPH